MSYGYRPYPQVHPNRPINPTIPGFAAYQQRRTAPASVHMVAILQYLAGIGCLLVAVLSVLVSVVGTHRSGTNLHGADALLIHVGLAIGAVVAFAGLVIIAIGRKIQRGRQWARVLILVLSVLSLGGTLYRGLGPEGQANALGGIVFPVLYLILLNTRTARSWFRSHTY